ncbi:alpha-amylase 3, chloroplastic-like isoform X1 [Lolium rigidum]|uniref:alpha-amylase 3, chloroplastic-like isoform X1 n=1 Tax=Lolium rigidum TaxID=89674 RepID=UPI001F5C3B67|nr:alpha-amylase 3, chloroplastic-like isoform X1 [Lolium rigidum]
MSAASWSIPAIPRAVPPARGGPHAPGEAFLVAARPRCRAAPRRLRLGRGAGGVVVARAGAAEVPVAGSGEAAVVFSDKFPLRRRKTVEGKAWVRVDAEPDGDGKCKIVVGCDLEGKWVLHWGVSYDGETGREWDQPPEEIRPPGSVPIKDSAVETPLEISHSSEGCVLHEVEIKFDKDTPIDVINFVLKEEGTGAWFQHKGGDFRIPLSGSLKDKDSSGAKQGDKLEGSNAQPKETVPEDKGPNRKFISQFYGEYPILKSEYVENSVSVTVTENSETNKSRVEFDTDITGDVIIHWGVCKGNTMTWEIPPEPHPPKTKIFRQKALQTLLEQKTDGSGNTISFLLNADYSGLVFILKLNEDTWLRNLESNFDFYIPLTRVDQIGSTQEPRKADEHKLDDKSSQTDGLISDIRNLVVGLSSRRGQRTKNKVLQEDILQEIERLAAEAYSIFRSPTIEIAEDSVYIDDPESVKPACSGTGSGFEILCQGFNWESHKSGKWYVELGTKAKELASLGFTIVWSPPPTDSVSPEGYMPRDLYNLNCRYGTMEELKQLVNIFHQNGMKVLGDAVLNHRCAQFQNQNGVWNIFGGRINWDDRAVVADDPHFQGRGNKSSGDNFHAAPNIDHSQDFVRNDLKEWLRWMRKEVGYDGWRLDFVRGFWGGYVKDYMEATEPYFAVGEYWDSLSYTYGEMDYNQDAHRQRIVDWINATNGTAGAFDVTTKGILHMALERSEYWRLSDEKGKPPGVLGWWPSRAVTFIENHDTGSTQGHWRFPYGMEMQGYAYILTHPGTPAVFYDHIFSHLQQDIARLISVRRRLKIQCRSKIKILKAEQNLYAAQIDETVTMKIGSGHFEPSGPINWTVAVEGHDYKIWEAPS